VRVLVSVASSSCQVTGADVFFFFFLFLIADVELSQKLREELKYETESNVDVPEVPEFLKAFQEQGLWQVRFGLV
jgi:hypothetical protein